VYRNEWIDRGLPAHSASARAAPPAPAGFSRAYHLCEARYALENLSKSRLKVSTFRDSNDPFELSAFYSRDAGERELLRDFIEVVSAKYGVLCFSEDWLDPVLWSHYANKHSGIALGFDIPSPKLLPVKYEKDRFEFPGDLTDEGVDRFLLTKFESWRYEREARVIIILRDVKNDGGRFFKRIGGELVLREVILGPLCSEDLLKVRACVDAVHSGVRTFKARLATKFFSVVPDEATIPTHA
jgi:hypothetical protein